MESWVCDLKTWWANTINSFKCNQYYIFIAIFQSRKNVYVENNTSTKKVFNFCHKGVYSLSDFWESFYPDQVWLNI